MDARKWNSILSQLPEPHILQTWEWGEFKSKYGWQPIHYIWCEDRTGYRLCFPEEIQFDSSVAAAALILERSLAIRGVKTSLRVHYVPKGPLIRDWSDENLRALVLEDLSRLARARGAIFVKIDPDVRLGIGLPEQSGSEQDAIAKGVISTLNAHGWRYSSEQIQFANTVIVDLSSDEGEILARMRQKTRYNIRLAQRKGVAVREGGLEDIPALYRMYRETSIRDGFVIRSTDYYANLWGAFIRAGFAKPLIAEIEGELVAALILFIFLKKSWFLFGMSRDVHREKMPNYLLQWEAIVRSKSAGCQVYDLWGAPYKFDQTDPLWGVYRFKEGLGGQVVRHIGAYDLPVRRFWYRLYMQYIPRFLAWMRARNLRRASAGPMGGL